MQKLRGKVNSSKVWILAPLLFLLSCKEQSGGDHLPADVMQKVLMDVNIAEAYSSMVHDSTYKNGAKNLDSLALYYKQIFDRHHITQAQFNASLDYYKTHIDEFDTLYNNLLPKITAMQTAQAAQTAPAAAPPPPPPAQ